MEHVTLNDDGTRTVWHGTYGWKTKHNVVMHWYAGIGGDDGSGFFEILEVRDPLPDQQPFLAHAYYSDIGSSCFGFATLADAEAGREELFGSGHLRRLDDPRYVPQLHGCLKAERTGHARPWVYAID